MPVRIYIGDEIDLWLADDDNLQKWESGFTARERRILMTTLLARAMDWHMSPANEKSRVGSFERTGCLMNLAPDEEEDEKIKPQGLSLPYKVPVRQNAKVVETSEPSEKPEEIVEPGQSRKMTAISLTPKETTQST